MSRTVKEGSQGRSSLPAAFAEPTRAWFEAVFRTPTRAQLAAWEPILRGEHVLLLAPTGSGKTLAAFLAAIDRLMFRPVQRVDEASPQVLARVPRDTKAKRSPKSVSEPRTRVIYVSPIKALAVDVERNLMAPLVGIEQAARRANVPCRAVTVAVRTGDTSARERRVINKGEADVLITTPESLFLMLTSRARDTLRAVETVIIDEIHALAGNERGAHLMLTLERLEHWVGRPVQRVGLSATQRPLAEVAMFLGGDRPVAIADASADKRIKLTLEMGEPGETAPADEPSTDADPAGARVDEGKPSSDGPSDGTRDGALDGAPDWDALQAELEGLNLAQQQAAGGLVSHLSAGHGRVTSQWARIYPRVLELIRAHQSTLVFVNSRRLAERMAQGLNELAEETLVYAHHGSVAREQREWIENQLKAGKLRALVATSSLELGIDMGAIDLVVQLEAPQSVASALQRIGRAGHHVGALSAGVLVPKHRGDLVACAGIADAVREGAVEHTRFLRNPLDVLAQQLVALAAMDDWHADALFALVRRSGPFLALPRAHFEGTLDMLSGFFPVEELAEVRPRITYDRATGRVTARAGAQRVVIANAGTIADRGLYGVYLVGAAEGKGRIGELDEEMVLETRPGETFVLGASTWRVEEITFDRVLVSPAPGEPGKMPFWRGENTMRSAELGRRIGALLRTLHSTARPARLPWLTGTLAMTPETAEVMLRYVEQQTQESVVPTDRVVVVESSIDDMGELRVCVLSPLGARVLAPWAMLAQRRAQEILGFDVEMMWTNDGFVIRLPEGVPSEISDDVAWLLPSHETALDDLTQLVGTSSIFAARFREACGRALLLPKRRPGQRRPLWQVRKKSQDLLRGAQRVTDFPMLVEAYRKCLTDVFDTPALVATLRDIAARRIRVVPKKVDAPSPFASTILFGFVANFMYEGDVPVLERKAAALAIDPARLRDLMGDVVSLREVIDPGVLEELERQLRLRGVRHAHLPESQAARDALHDKLLLLGDVTPDELEPGEIISVALLEHERRAVSLRFAGRELWIPVEYAARYRDALGVPLPLGLPSAYLAKGGDPTRDLLRRFAKTHGPFTVDDVVVRYGTPASLVRELLANLVLADDLRQGEFRPDRPAGSNEFVSRDVLASLRSRSLAQLRREVAPLEPIVYTRFLHAWHGVAAPRRGLDALLDAIERLQGYPVLASSLESDILPARVDGYRPADLDTLAAAGEVVWHGVAASGERDGRIALYLADQAEALRGAMRDADLEQVEDLSPVAREIVTLLSSKGALFFGEIRGALGRFPGDLLRELWSLVWSGWVSNDSFRPLRELQATHASSQPASRRAARGPAFRSRREVPRGAEGRWTLVSRAPSAVPLASDTAQSARTEGALRVVRQWLVRHGLVTKEIVASESLAGGFSVAYPVLRTMDETGQVRRGHFVAGVSALQFAAPAAVELLRVKQHAPPELEVVILAASDVANPYGGTLPWPEVMVGRAKRMQGAWVWTVDGACAAWAARDFEDLWVWLPQVDPERAKFASALARAMVSRMRHISMTRGMRLQVAQINGEPALKHALSDALLASGMIAASSSLLLERVTTGRTPALS
jgi:ATP-dependent Lhr-like helicase